MVSYSILCTDSRNGGQCELLIVAASPEQAQQHVSSWNDEGASFEELASLIEEHL